MLARNQYLPGGLLPGSPRRAGAARKLPAGLGGPPWLLSLPPGPPRCSLGLRGGPLVLDSHQPYAFGGFSPCASGGVSLPFLAYFLRPFPPSALYPCQLTQQLPTPPTPTPRPTLQVPEREPETPRRPSAALPPLFPHPGGLWQCPGALLLPCPLLAVARLTAIGTHNTVRPRWAPQIPSGDPETNHCVWGEGGEGTPDGLFSGQPGAAQHSRGSSVADQGERVRETPPPSLVGRDPPFWICRSPSPAAKPPQGHPSLPSPARLTLGACSSDSI